MLLYLVCPSCLDARERETIEYRKGVPCPTCQAQLLLVLESGVHLAVHCGGCRHVFAGMEGRADIYAEDYRCPQCKRQTYPPPLKPEGES